MKTENQIIMIPIEKIFPHPENPRKDLGDLTELTESILKHGVLQNLTVVPWSDWYNTDPPVEDAVISIIGHRRCAAAKAAGKTELPCVITHMDEHTQIATMLLENIQRSDLTPVEQAHGFQMMIDLGETEESIAEKTGFSRSTVRHRLNIAQLDQTLLKKKEDQEGFQLSLTDLYALEKIKDVKRRNKVLKRAESGRQIASLALNEVRDEKREETKEIVLQMFKTAGVKKNDKAKYELYSNKWEVLQEIDLDKAPPKKISLPADAKEVFWCETYSPYIKVFRKATKQEKKLTPAEIRQKELENKRKQIIALNKKMKNDMAEFIDAILDSKNSTITYLDENTAIRLLWKTLMCVRIYISKSDLFASIYKKDSWAVTDEEKKKAKSSVESMSLQEQMLRLLRQNILNIGETVDYNGGFKEFNTFDIWLPIFDTLRKYGFVWSDPQYIAVLDGSHELYAKQSKK